MNDDDDEIESILELIDEYYNETKHLQYLSEYKNTLLDDLMEIINYDEDYYDNEMIETFVDYYFDIIGVPNKYSFYYNELEENDIDSDESPDKLFKTIMRLKDEPIIEQRTQEWLEMRHNMLSASNIYRAFKSQATISSLVRDKSSPLENTTYNAKGGLHNPMAWGTLFEPVSVSIYEMINKTKIGTFGCIKHKKWEFLGASPDGINVLPTNHEKFGKMLEIKNIYNREITGIPMSEYWVQMQLQMEVCDLPMCDFLETRFCLYENIDEFIEDKYDSGIFRGAFIQSEDYTYSHFYLWDCWCGEIETFMFLLDNEKKINGGFVHFWYLEEYSCVLVKRNSNWFSAILPRLNETWKMILEARTVSPVAKRKKGPEICLIKIE
jgi:putative phage-type endonuclease